ncbi:hypothetical protein GQ600_12914 [Phytophthora cactorum]|nr:hypothetical protein GQ600_12914 [Phytophthora cactorum]
MPLSITYDRIDDRKWLRLKSSDATLYDAYLRTFTTVTLGSAEYSRSVYDVGHAAGHSWREIGI